MMNFPLVFAAVCLAFGLASLWSTRPRVAVPLRTLLLLAGVGLAVGGWIYQGRVLREKMAEAQSEAFQALGGKPAPSLAGLEPLGTDPGALSAAASFSGRATLVAFWATWCSPCWKEMEELEELFQDKRGEGLTVLALTSYDHPEDEEGREEDRAEAEAFLRKRGLSYPAAITADDEIYRAYRVRSIPTTALIDADGQVAAYGVGLDGARALMAQAAAMVGPTAES